MAGGVVEARPAAQVRNARYHIAEVRKALDPGFAVERLGPAGDVTRRAAEVDVDLVGTAGADADPPPSVPVLDRYLLRIGARPCYQVSAATVLEVCHCETKLQPIPNPRVDAVCSDHEIRTESLAVFENKLAVTCRVRDRGSSNDLRARSGRCICERLVELRAQYQVETRPAHHPRALQQPAALVAELPVPDGLGAGGRPLEGSDRLERPDAVLPDEDPGSDLSELVSLLVDSNRPAAPGEDGCRSQPGDAGAGDLGMPPHGGFFVGDRPAHRAPAASALTTPTAPLAAADPSVVASATVRG